MNPEKSKKIVLLNNNDILPNRFQPRKRFPEEDLLDLCESIKKYGVLEPIIVRPLGDKYELVAGERRYKANVLAGNDEIPAIIKDLEDIECTEIAIIENLQRKNLSAIEEALSYKRAIDLGYATQQQLADKVGKSQSYIANKIRLLKLSDEVQEALLDNKISERHARSLLRLDSLQKQNELLRKIINERLTVRKTDEEIDKMNNENINNVESNTLQTTPLNTIFDNKKETNNNEIYSFGPGAETSSYAGPAFMSFDANGNPIANNNEKINSDSQVNMFGVNTQPAPEIAPEATPVQPMGAETQVVEQPQPFNMFSTPEVAPVQPMRAETQVVEQPQPFNMFSAPEATPVQPMGAEPQVVEQPQPFNMFSAPEAAPVQPMDQIGKNQNNIPFSVNNENNDNLMPQTPIFNNNQSNDTIAEYTKPEPIIVTDYSKQYDPVMPQTQPKEPDIDFKTIINLIRQCSDTIEKCGYKIETEEYDLDNLYQVVFKINKNN